jgi:hypothetical protein
LFGNIGLKTEQESNRSRKGWFHLLHSNRVKKFEGIKNRKAPNPSVFKKISLPAPNDKKMVSFLV